MHAYISDDYEKERLLDWVDTSTDVSRAFGVEGSKKGD